MASRLYVGNLPYDFTSQDLQKLFGPHGVVRGAEVIMDRMTGRSRGFGFVEMDSDSASQAAIAALHEKDINGRRITVNEARERAPRAPGSSPRPPSGGGGFGGGSPGGGSGGFGAPRPAARGDRGDGRPRRDRYADGGGGGGGGRPRRRDDDDAS